MTTVNAVIGNFPFESYAKQLHDRLVSELFGKGSMSDVRLTHMFVGRYDSATNTGKKSQDGIDIVMKDKVDYTDSDDSGAHQWILDEEDDVSQNMKALMSGVLMSPEQKAKLLNKFKLLKSITNRTMRDDEERKLNYLVSNCRLTPAQARDRLQATQTEAAARRVDWGSVY